MLSCGVCHSDLSMAKNEWGFTQYPFVGGHEVYGVVERVGSEVKGIKVGQRAGVGWPSGACMDCKDCRVGDHTMCASGKSTIVGRHGGFADKVRVQSVAAIPIPDGYESDAIGPLMCGGITVFAPILEYVRPEHKVGVIGIGGLGSMAVQFLNKVGCHVTAFTSSEAKRKSALELGAHDTISSVDEKELAAAAGRFDVIISTVNVPLNWNLYIGTLKSRGRLHIVGAVLEPLSISVFPLMMGHKSVSGSPVAGFELSRTMINFAHRHNIRPQVKVFPFEKINEAFAEMEKQVQGRVVLKW